MSISERLTQDKLLEILTDSFEKGQADESMKVEDLLEDIKIRVLTAINGK